MAPLLDVGEFHVRYPAVHAVALDALDRSGERLALRQAERANGRVAIQVVHRGEPHPCPHLLRSRTTPAAVVSRHTNWITAVACTVLAGRPVAVTSSLDRTVRVWDLATRGMLGDPLTR